MNLDHVEALASPSPIVAALARAHAQAQARSKAVAQVENRENVLEQTNGNHEQEQIPNENDETRKRKRAIQQVALVETRVKVIKWMVKDAEENAEKGVAVRAIKNFQADFRGEYKLCANHMKCTRWWKDREGILTTADASVKSISTVLNTRVKRVQVKVAVGGRGSQRAPWTERLHELLLVEFSRMSATVIKLSPSLLRTIALAIIEGSEEWAAEYGSGYVNLSDNIPVKEKIKTRWVQLFMNSNNIVIRMQTGKLSFSPEKELQIEKTVAFYVGELHRGFTAGILDENLIRNMDETHFVTNLVTGAHSDFVEILM
ncbi:hypothetical protein PsorP6_001955 [Peronosclerospora sorghi]|uniref:Uncharacterized protein n=1 Tax=Peronosclerospora sorghi TaxID=230839 RepID=A0ACC0WT87_9STRA|nr:hypothetical protein PsorP6_001955 [Peronosclerospora sorghi]